MGGLEEEGEERRDVRLRFGQSLGGLVRKGQGGTEGMVWMHNLSLLISSCCFSSLFLISWTGMRPHFAVYIPHVAHSVPLRISFGKLKTFANSPRFSTSWGFRSRQHFWKIWSEMPSHHLQQRICPSLLPGNCDLHWRVYRLACLRSVSNSLVHLTVLLKHHYSASCDTFSFTGCRIKLQGFVC